MCSIPYKHFQLTKLKVKGGACMENNAQGFDLRHYDYSADKLAQLLIEDEPINANPYLVRGRIVRLCKNYLNTTLYKQAKIAVNDRILLWEVNNII